MKCLQQYFLDDKKPMKKKWKMLIKNGKLYYILYLHVHYIVKLVLLK